MTKGNGSTKPQPVEINGTTYRSIEQAARKFGLSGTTLANRLNRGLTGNELTKPAVTKATPVEIEGKTYPSVAAAARDFGMCETLLRARLRRGLTGGALLQAPGALQWNRPKPSAPKQEEDEEGQALIAAISDDRYFRAILFPKARKLRLERLAFPFALHGAEVSTHTTPKSFLAEWDRVVGRPSQKIIKLAVTALSAKN